MLPAASSLPGVKVKPEQDDATPWGSSSTAWYVLLGVLATVVVTVVAGSIAGAGTLSAVAVVGGVLRLVLPRATGLAARSRAFDVTVLLGLGLALAVIAAVVPQ